MKTYFYCIDIGGTDIKAGIVDEKYNILFTDQISSKSINSKQQLKKSILAILSLLETKSQLKLQNASGLGIGFPGLVDSELGVVEYLPNLGISKYNIIKDLSKEINIPIKIANDAELALLAENKLGAGKGTSNMALITLGTGVGLGLMINGKNLRSTLPFSSEYGHNLFGSAGESLESIVSTRALTNKIISAMQNNPDSKIWTKYNLETASAKALFDFKDEDELAQALFNEYISNLGRAVVNIYNILSPEIILIGGGISKQGIKLTKPLEEFANNHIFLKSIGKKIKIAPAKFLNNAGLLGARCLFN